ncbi:MAG: pyridoxal-phosphate dependent enzyme [Gemmatimonadota bacterium]|nr:pyridoxal-phosphate dependent enzyme [Gemmatimonadota bacterium]
MSSPERRALAPPSLQEIEDALGRIADLALRTPLLPLNDEEAPAEIALKLESLQPIGSFKIRGAGNAMRSADPGAVEDGVYTASAGNMAQGVAWVARELGIPCSVVVPDHAPETKLAAIERLGGSVVKIPFEEWWEVLVEHGYDGLDGFFVHPVADPTVIAGNGTIGLEIVEDLSALDAVVVPYGGGGLSCGIAAAVKAKRPGTKVYAAEVATAAPLAAALEAGEPVPIDYTASFVDGIGSGRVLDEMWPLAEELLDGAIVVGLDEVAGAIRLLVERNRVVAEGAGAAPVAAAMTGEAGSGRVACVVSGGNIDAGKLARILEGERP